MPLISGYPKKRKPKKRKMTRAARKRQKFIDQDYHLSGRATLDRQGDKTREQWQAVSQREAEHQEKLKKMGVHGFETRDPSFTGGSYGKNDRMLSKVTGAFRRRKR